MVELPFDSNALNPHDKALYETMVAKRKQEGAPFGGPYAALMNHPALCEKVEALGFYLKFEGHLPREVYQFVVLAVAKATGAEFEWKDHVKHALSAGLTEEIIEALRLNGAENQQFPEPYGLVAEILTATLVWKNIPEKTQNQAIEKFGKCGFVEIVVLSGFYQMFSAINQGFNIS